MSKSEEKDVYYYLFIPEVPKGDLGLAKNVRVIGAKEIIAGIE